jgi:hypothetical protein
VRSVTNNVSDLRTSRFSPSRWINLHKLGHRLMHGEDNGSISRSISLLFGFIESLWYTLDLVEWRIVGHGPT